MGFDLMIAAIVFGLGGVALGWYAQRGYTAHEALQIEAAERKLLTGSETPEFVRKLNQLAPDQLVEAEQKIKEKLPEILDSILAVATEKSLSLDITVLFPWARIERIRIHEHVRNVLAKLLRQQGLKVRLGNSDYYSERDCVYVAW